MLKLPAMASAMMHFIQPNQTRKPAVRVVLSKELWLTPVLFLSRWTTSMLMGTSTKYNDLVEPNAICKVYGEQGKYRLPISSSKSMVGHTLVQPG